MLRAQQASRGANCPTAPHQLRRKPVRVAAPSRSLTVRTCAAAADSNEQSTHQTTSPQHTIFSKLGGAPAIKAAVDIFYDKVMADPRVNYFFDGVDMRAQRAHQAAFLNFALGGAENYDGNANMTAAHASLVRQHGLRMEHFDVVLEHLGGALTDLDVPQELIGEAADVVETLRPAFQLAIDQAEG